MAFLLYGMKRVDEIDNGGFTLIEVIAVLILLGILAAVAVPKYLSMQDKAREMAVNGALAAGVSNTTLAHGKFLVVNQSSPTGIVSNSWTDGSNNQAIATDLNDFTATYSYASGSVTVTITSGPGWFAGYSGPVSKTFPMSL